jgi:small subunit ribosomal protein S3
VGQKVHPTGFRMGITQPHRSTWFSEYSSFSDILKEDYKLRRFFEREFPLLYTYWFMGQEETRWSRRTVRNEIRSVGGSIFRLEIKRKIVGELEILIYSTRGRALTSYLENQEALLNLKNTLKKLNTTSPFVENDRLIRLKILILSNTNDESILVARALVEQLEKRAVVRRALREFKQKLQVTGVKGFKVQVSGRFNGRSIASVEWVKGGRLPLQTLQADISYTALPAYTISGILGVKVWIFNKEVN